MFAALVMVIIGAAMPSQVQEPVYTVHRVDVLPELEAGWDAPKWAQAELVLINRFHARGSEHRPLTRARVLHDGNNIAVIFRVEDRHVTAKHTEYQSPTHEDSCVEFFAKPKNERGYLNFEFNAIGTLLLWYVEKPRGPDRQFQKYTEVPREVARQIEVYASLSGPIENEITSPVTWTLSFRVPVALFEQFTGPIGDVSGQTWTGNFYKCADRSSRPHWGYWADVGEKLDFHQPTRFGRLVFE